MKKDLIFKISTMLIKIFVSISIFIIFVVPLLLIYLHIYPPRFANDVTPKDYGFNYSDTNVTTGDGINLKGWYIPHKNSKGTVIICHGVGANKSNILPVAEIFHSGGYELYLYDFRNHGDSDNAKVTYGFNETKDIKAIVEHIKSTGVEKIGIYGLSMGGGIVMLSLEDNPEIVAVIIDSSYASVEKVMKYRIKKVFPEPIATIIAEMTKIYAKVFFQVSFDKLIPLNIISKINRPIMFIAGDKDTNITPDNSKMLYDKAINPKELLIIKNAGHIDTIYNPEFRVKTIEFMNKYLQQEVFVETSA